VRDVIYKCARRIAEEHGIGLVICACNNPDLVKIVVAWTSLDMKRGDILSGLPAGSESEAWEWLWENMTYNLKELKEKIGISFSELTLAE
jgi:hypothetical protein